MDAIASFVSFPNTPNNPREPYRPEDNDGDGLYDEDQTEDVDGDGELSVMYMEDPDGPLKLSADGRRFVEVTDSTERVRRFRRIGSEGYDNDGDGRINEDDIGGPDPNRNFPFGWNLQAGNPYPMSESETRNVFEFQRAHPPRRVGSVADASGHMRTAWPSCASPTSTRSCSIGRLHPSTSTTWTCRPRLLPRVPGFSRTTHRYSQG